jgi:hypothetical protein
MTAAADGSVLGDDCKLYYSATLGGAGALTEIPEVIDVTVGTERRAVESNCRGDGEVSEHTGKPKHSISATLLMKRGTPGTTFAALRTAYAAGTTLHWAVSSGTITNTGNYVFRMEGRLKRFEESQPDNDTVKVSVEIAKAADSSYASAFSVVTE